MSMSKNSKIYAIFAFFAAAAVVVTVGVSNIGSKGNTVFGDTVPYVMNLSNTKSPLTEVSGHLEGESDMSTKFNIYNATTENEDWFGSTQETNGYFLFTDEIHQAISFSITYSLNEETKYPFTFYSSYFKLNQDNLLANSVTSYTDPDVTIESGESTETITASQLPNIGTYGYLGFSFDPGLASSSTLVISIISMKITYSCSSKNIADPAGFAYSTVDGVAGNYIYTHHIQTADQFRNIITYTNYGQGSATTRYIIDNDINFGGSIWNTDALKTTLASYHFSGILDGGKYSSGDIYSSSAPTSSITLSGVAVDWKVGSSMFDVNNACGLFYAIKNGVFNSFKLSNFSMNIADGKGVGLIASGLVKDATYTATGEFNYVVIDDTCSITSVANTGGFLGYAREEKSLAFNCCENHAPINCTGTNIGGFVGTMTVCPSGMSLTLTNCVNAGDIHGSSYVSGFIAAANNNANQDYTFTNNLSKGDVYASATNPYIGFFVANVSTSGNTVLGSWTFTGNTTESTARLHYLLTSTIPTGSIELTPLDDGSGTDYLSIVNVASNYTKAQFKSAVSENYNITVMTISFDDTTKALSSTDVTGAASYSLTISVARHTIVRASGAFVSVGSYNIYSDTFTSLSDIHIMKVLQAAYFKTASGDATGVNDPYIYTTFLIDDIAKKGTSSAGEYDYTDGYHPAQISGNYGAYAIVENTDTSIITYNALVDKGQNVNYFINAFDSEGKLIGQGQYVDYKASSTNLVPYAGNL